MISVLPPSICWMLSMSISTNRFEITRRTSSRLPVNRYSLPDMFAKVTNDGASNTFVAHADNRLATRRQQIVPPLDTGHRTWLSIRKRLHGKGLLHLR